MKLNDNTSVAMPIRNLLSIIIAVAIGVWAYFGVIARLTQVETALVLTEKDLEKNTEFRIKWPRGEMGSLPADSEQYMLIEFMASTLRGLTMPKYLSVSEIGKLTLVHKDICFRSWSQKGLIISQPTT